MNVNGSNQHQLYAPGNQVDPYVRSWSPDGQSIAFTRTEWVYYKGNWYWTRARPYWVGAQGGYADWFDYDWEVDWYPDWQTADISAPTSYVEPLPAYSRDDVTVRWSGVDHGSSGIKSYDIQYRIGQGGAWENWLLAETYYTQKLFEMKPGQTVYFRSRAVDNAGNVEAWPPGDGDAKVTFYNWSISGRASDNRGMPLPGVTISTTYNAFEVWPSNEQGAYLAYLVGNDNTFSVGWHKPGYEALPMTTFSGNVDSRHDIVLPPPDNVLEDWGFESCDSANSAWGFSSVDTPTMIDTERHSGECAIQLNPPSRQSERRNRMDSADSALWQQVTIPAGMNRPTLSFFSWQSGDGLRVLVDDGLAVTQVYTGTPSTGWAHQWMDLSAWSGQTVTVTLAVPVEAGEIASWAYLDEVTLGSAHPDAWAVLDTLAEAAPGETLVLVLDYGNLGAVEARQSQISVTLPAELTFAGATPQPSTVGQRLVWQVGDIAAGSQGTTIVISTTLAADVPLAAPLAIAAEIASATPEIELANNSFTMTIRAGRTVLLPLVWRSLDFSATLDRLQGDDNPRQLPEPWTVVQGEPAGALLGSMVKIRDDLCRPGI